MARCKDWGKPHEHAHGTTSGWGYHGCRCAECHEAHYEFHRAAEKRRGPRTSYAKRHRQAMRERVSEGFRDFTHGRAAYSSYGCRCEVCKAAYSAYATSDEVRTYQRAYRDGNREQVRKAQRQAARRRRATNPLYDVAHQEKYRESHRELARQRCRDYYLRNRDYELERHRRKRQRLTAVPAENRGRRWSAEEESIVADLSLSLVEAAYKTGRTVQAVSRRRFVLSQREKEQAA